MKKNEFISEHLLDEREDIISQLTTDYGVSCDIREKFTINRKLLGDRFIIAYGYFFVGERFSILENFIKTKIFKVFDKEINLYIEMSIDEDNLILIYNEPFNDKGCYRTDLQNEKRKITELPKIIDSLSFSFLVDIDDWEYIDLKKVINDKFDELYNLYISVF